MSESIVLLVLGACWVAYLSWYWRENRRRTPQRGDGIRSFASGLGSLGGSANRSRPAPILQPTLAPRSADAAARRRRDVLMSSGVICVITLLGAVALGPLALIVHLMADAVFVAYGFAVLQRRSRAAEREMKVHMLHPERQVKTVSIGRAANG